MARGFRVWVELDSATGQPVARAARMHARAGPAPRSGSLPATDIDGAWPLGRPWALLLALLNLERRVPPYDWPRHQWIDGVGPEWSDWLQFQANAGAPYLLAEDQGHPLVWYPATDGEMWGFLFNFGLRGGAWHWWVPGTERVVRDPETGGTLIVMGERHPEAADGRTMRELLESAPPGLFDVDSAEFLTVQEALDGELQRHSADERNRCRFFVYPGTAQVHRDGAHPEYGWQTLEAQLQAIASVAWTCLSPHPALWNPLVTFDWRSELGGHANVDPDDAETERKLAAMPSTERYARIPSRRFWGPDQQAFAFDGNPLGRYLERLTADPRVAPATSPRVLANVQRKAAGTLEADAPPSPTERGAERASRARAQQTATARRRLARALAVGQAFTTTDIFAAVAQQVVWAVQLGLTIRACGHPECGTAFVPETGRHLYCPEHRSGTARAQRARSPRPGIPPWER